MTHESTDPLIEEIHETRREIAKRFNFDIRQISDDARRRQELEGRPVWHPKSASQAISPVDRGADSDRGSSAPAGG